MTNQTQDPTPEQEAQYAMQCEIDYLKEQVTSAAYVIGILREMLHDYASEDEFASCQGAGTYGKNAMNEVQPSIDMADAWISQNTGAK
jgi:hypothetical protein